MEFTQEHYNRLMAFWERYEFFEVDELDLVCSGEIERYQKILKGLKQFNDWEVLKYEEEIAQALVVVLKNEDVEVIKKELLGISTAFNGRAGWKRPDYYKHFNTLALAVRKHLVEQVRKGEE